ncbi:MAG: sigma 54-interacting transcriptional regulator [Bradymonadaceae bacterium]
MTADDRLGERIWREVSQSASSLEVAQGVSDLLAEYLAHERFILARLDLEQERVVIVESIDRGDDIASEEATAWRIGVGEGFDELVDWCRQPRTVVGRVADIGDAFARVCPWDPSDRALVVTLQRDDEEIGFAATRLSGEQSAEDEDGEDAFEEISEPLSAALSYEHGFGDAAAATAERPEVRREHYQRVKRRELTDIIMDARTGLGDVAEWVRSVAPSSEPILLIGETGTGKEVVARTVHKNSEFSDGPMVRVNCGALTGGIVDTKLFGTVEEDFTPATRQEGWLERARGGTLFLDEIDQLPRSAQEKLAEWIETGKLERPDAEETYSPDVRLVAGNHRDVEEVEDFDPKLAELLSTFPIHIPPLRARPEDIPALATQFAERVGRRMGGAPLTPSPEDIELLVDYDWPGNIRELRSVIERAAIIGNGKELHIRRALGTPGSHEEAGAVEEDADGVGTLDEAVRDHLIKALRSTGGQVAGDGGAADLLDVHPSTLRSKLKRHDLDPADYR